MKALTFPTAVAAALVFATLSYAQTSPTQTAPGGNPAFPTAGAPADAPTLQEQVNKTPVPAASPAFPAAGAAADAPTLKEQTAKTPGASGANDAFPSAGAPLTKKEGN